ncbi:MAG: hypothetical protein J5606_10315 [Bacteroidales bacterium]|nr:hypothetical protein [Bacteroidales bacterium]
MKKFIKIFVLLILPLCSSWAQRKSDFSIMEESIAALHGSMLVEPSAEIRYQKNEELLRLLEETLTMKNSFNYKFDSLKTISVLTSPDKKVRIFTWYVLDKDNNCDCFGFLQAYSEHQNRYLLYPLIDKSKKIPNPAIQPLSHSSWFGAIYSQILETKTSAHTYYTLLGWNGGDQFTQYKVIDVLSLNARGLPTFGATIFRKYSKTKYYRIIFEYAKGARLHMYYGKEYYAKRSEKKNKKTNRYTYDTIPMDMIIFNELIPLDESLAKVPQYYVPESSLNSAFIEKDGFWEFKKGVIGKNKNTMPTPPANKEKNKPRIFYKPEQ